MSATAIGLLGGVTAVSYGLYRWLRSCSKRTLSYSWPMAYKNYYGEDPGSSSVGSDAQLGPGYPQAATPEVPGVNTGRSGCVLQPDPRGPGRYFSIWKIGVPEGYEHTRVKGVSAIRPVSGGTISDFFGLKWS